MTPAASHSLDSPSPDPSLRPGGHTPLRVLLAEDDSERRAQIAGVLGSAGYAVRESATGEEVLAAYAGDPTPVVLLNTDLAGAAGVEVCRRIRALDPMRATYVLVYSRQDCMPAVVEALEAGADDYILNPDDPDILRTRLTIAEKRLAREEERRSAEADAARARYMAGVGEMAIALQHEINNPLAAILAHAELMVMDAGEPASADDSLTTILEQARRIADVVRRLSSLRNPTSVEYVPGKRMVHLHDEG